MAIKFEGREYKLRVQPGPEGLALFKSQVRELLGFDITEVCLLAQLLCLLIRLLRSYSMRGLTSCLCLHSTERPAPFDCPVCALHADYHATIALRCALQDFDVSFECQVSAQCHLWQQRLV